VIDSPSSSQSPVTSTPMDNAEPASLTVSHAPHPATGPTAANAKDRDARLRRMVGSYFDIVWRSLRRLGVAPGAVDDASQQVFMVAARKLDIIEVSGEKAYLMGIAVRVASDSRRAHTRRREVFDEDHERHPDPAFAQDELLDRKRARQVLEDVLALMPMDLRAPFTMFELEGMSLPEIASALEVPLGTATSRLRRAREVFREHLLNLNRNNKSGPGPGGEHD
jgi:RNA polymerase sigma-70 factor (ECF subfamily)